MHPTSESSATNRESIQLNKMSIPACPIPRAGENVTWFSGTRRESGELLCYTGAGDPIVRERQFGNEHRPRSIHAVRRTDPLRPKGPNWSQLQAPAKIVSPLAVEKAAFATLLNEVIPPGLRYQDVIEELWGRGFEVYLVGGTVRDVISGRSPNDVDLTTTMPLRWAVDALDGMFDLRGKNPLHQPTGFLRLGGTPASQDPFIDLKMFSMHNLGRSDARFGVEFCDDIAHRDFACNAIYYDPVNQALIDPTGKGIEDAEARRLTLVADRNRKNGRDLGKICIRFFKFVAQGFAALEETTKEIREYYLPSLASLPKSQLVAYIRTQVLSKVDCADRPATLSAFCCAFGKVAAGSAFSDHIERLLPHLELGDTE